MKKIAIFITTIFLVFSGVLATPVNFASAQTAALPTSAGQANIESALTNGCSPGQFSMCVLWFIYNIILGLSFWVVGLVASIFDFFLSYTLNSEAYRSDFIIKGWGVIRDISNVAFIFTLLYLAIRHILGMSAKKYIPTLIIVALLLNFSLFFTKIVIDAGNILARAFYNSMVIEGTPNADPNIKNISVAIVSKINPQQLLGQAIFQKKLTTGNLDTATGQIVTPPSGSSEYLEQTISSDWGFFAFIFILVTFVNFTLAGVFLSVALLLVGRTVGLWFAMIFSPIAFITLAVPNSAGFVKQLSFDTWKDTVLKLSFLAPIFLFFLYLIITFLTVIFSSPLPSENTDTFVRIMTVFIPFAFVLTLLTIAKKTATEMAGEIGGTIKSLAGKIGSMVGGAALGSAAFAGRKIIGGAAGRNLTLGNYQERIQRAEELGDTAAARRLTRKMETMKKIYSSSFDIRNAGESKGVAGWAARQVGSGLRSGMTDFGGDKFAVGKGSKESRKKYVDDIKKERLDLAQELGNIGENEDSQIRLRELRRQSANAQITRRDLLRTGQSTQAIDADIARQNADMQRIRGAHAEISQTRRNMFANRLEDSIWESLISGVENTELHADEIRQGNRSRTPEQKALDAIRALNTTPPPNTPPPNTPPPNTPPPGP